ncbi:AmmeMemoRadiSam system radical SAM enzyme [bacterium]|nr:AmmeMemoRadiSam system radical SAM enzyme [candidate division CSSED10-310 bacterium]
MSSGEMNEAGNVRWNRFAESVSRREFLMGMGASVAAMCLPGKVLAGPDGHYGPLTESPARFYRKLDHDRVQCVQCFRGCLIAEGKSGACEIRINRGGELKTVSYGNPGAINVDPIEKKPFFHVLPGTSSFSIAAVGCNIDCDFCQNWQIAQVSPGRLQVDSRTPEQIASEAVNARCTTIAYTYSEPVVWSEYVLDCTRAGLKKGIRSVVVSNGSWSGEVLRELTRVVTAIKVDLKSINSAYYERICHGDIRPVLDNIVAIRRSGVWLELVNLVVPTLNDTPEEFRKMAQWIREYLGTDVPLHFSRFHPMYRLQHLAPTPLKTLNQARDIALAEGLSYVYIGNVPSHAGENTVCRGCGKTLIHRSGYQVKIVGMTAGRCSACGTSVPGVWATSPDTTSL